MKFPAVMVGLGLSIASLAFAGAAASGTGGKAACANMAGCPDMKACCESGMKDCPMAKQATVASCGRCNATEPSTEPTTKPVAMAEAPVALMADMGHEMHGHDMPKASTSAPATSTAPAVTPIGNTICPVMGGDEIDKSVYADYQGKRVYFCCKECLPKFNKDPEKYMKAMAEHPEKYGIKKDAK